METLPFNLIAAIVAAVAGFMVGGLWYSPVLFSKAWQVEAGMSCGKAEGGGTARIFGLAFLATLIAALNLAAFIGRGKGLSFGLFAGFAAGFGWVTMALGIIYLFERRSLKLWLINSGYMTVAFTVMGVVIGVWPE